MSLAVYVYQDANRNQITIDSNDYNYTGTWSAFGSYYSSTLDTADYGNGRYITIIDNVGVNPLYVPPRSQPKKWSPLVKIIPGDEPPYPPTPPGTASVDQLFATGTNALYAAWTGTYLAGKAYDLASIGTNVGTNAFNLATSAAAEAASAVDLANQALQTAWLGTNATGATALAYTALQTAWSGTSGANAALALAASGTNEAAGAVVLANTAVTTSWAGTNAIPLANQALRTSWAGTNAIDLANQALQTAWLGTNATGSTALAYTALQTAWTGTAEAAAAIVLANQGVAQSWAGTSAVDLANTAVQSSWAGTNAITLANQALVLAEAGTVIPPLSTLPDVNIPSPTAQQVLTYDGSKWVATTPVSTASPSVGFTYYLDDTATGTAGYDTLTTSPTGGAEVQDTITVTASEGQKPFAHAYLSGTINRTLVDAGVWEFNTYITVVPSTGTTIGQVVTKIYTRSIAGVETPLFTVASADIGALSPDLTSTITVQGTFATALTDKLVAKYYGQTDDTGTVTMTLYHNGTAHYSHFHTPLATKHNDLSGLQGGAFDEYYHLTKDQSDAAAGSSGSPSTSNKFVTELSLSAEQSARSLADQANTDLALTGLQTAWTGTSRAESAYSLAAIGTNVGTNALNEASSAIVLANQALQTAWVGTVATGGAAYNLAAIGTNVGTNALNEASAAINLANQALQTAWVGTVATGQAAYSLAAIGTNVGTNALTAASVANALAYTALTTAWVGTSSSGGAAYSLAAIGTNVGTNALNEASAAIVLANQALTTAWVGTNASGGAAYNLAAIGTNVGTNALNEASAAITLANQALTTAWLGTNAGGGSVANIGTGAGQIYAQTSGGTHQLRTITAGANISVINGASDVIIASTSSAGGALDVLQVQVFS